MDFYPDYFNPYRFDNNQTLKLPTLTEISASLPLFKKEKDALFIIHDSGVWVSIMRKVPIDSCMFYSEVTLDCLACYFSVNIPSKTGKSCRNNFENCEVFSDYADECEKCSDNYVLSENRKICAFFIRNCSRYDFSGRCSLCSNGYPPLLSSEYFNEELNVQCTSILTITDLKIPYLEIIKESGFSIYFDIVLLKKGVFLLYLQYIYFDYITYFDVYCEIFQVNSSSNTSLMESKGHYFDHFGAHSDMLISRLRKEKEKMIISTLLQNCDFDKQCGLAKFQLRFDPETFKFNSTYIDIKDIESSQPHSETLKFNSQLNLLKNGDYLGIWFSGSDPNVFFQLFDYNFKREKYSFRSSFGPYDNLVVESLEMQRFVVCRIANKTDLMNNYSTLSLAFFNIDPLTSEITPSITQEIFTYSLVQTHNFTSKIYSEFKNSALLLCRYERSFYLFWQESIIGEILYQKFSFAGLPSPVASISCKARGAPFQLGNVDLLADGRFVLIWAELNEKSVLALGTSKDKVFHFRGSCIPHT